MIPGLCFFPASVAFRVMVFSVALQTARASRRADRKLIRTIRSHDRRIEVHEVSIRRSAPALHSVGRMAGRA